MEKKIYRWLIWFFLMNQFVELFIHLGIDLEILKDISIATKDPLFYTIVTILSGVAFTVYTKNMDKFEV